MCKSQNARAVDWVLGLDYGRWFYTHEVPGAPQIVYPVLSRLCKDKNTGVKRVAKGLYWRGWPSSNPQHWRTPKYQIAGLLLAGPGAGLGSWSALHALRWTTQSPVVSLLTTLRKPHSRLPSSVRFTVNRNQRRKELNWNEVTILEGVHMFEWSEEPWHECLSASRRGLSQYHLPSIDTIHPDKLVWAAETESEMTAEKQHMIQEAANVFTEQSQSNE